MRGFMEGGGPKSINRRSWLPNVVLVGGLIVTFLVSVIFATGIENRLQHKFATDVEAARDNIQTRLETYFTLLRGAGALFAANREVTRPEWELYVDRLRIREFYPGLQGLGFSLRMYADETNRVTLWMEGQGATDFHIWPEFARPEFHSILFLSPLDKRNVAAIGYDMYTDPVRREAMDAAWTNGTITASGKVRLVQEIERPEQAGFLVYLPVYHATEAPETPAQRRADLHGFVYAPLRADDFLQALFGKGTPLPLQMEVYDGNPEPQNLLHRAKALHSSRPHLQARTTVTVADRQWTLHFSSPPEYEQSIGRTFIPVVPLIGVALSLVLYFSSNAQARARQRAEKAATELAASEELHRTISETAADAILMMNEQSIILSANRAAEQLFGYSAAELIGQPMTNLMPERMRAPHREGIEHFLRAGKRHIPWNGVELPALHKDGHEIPVEISFGMSRRNGSVVFTGFVRDITKRKQAEAALKTAQDQLAKHAADLERKVAERTARLSETIGELEAFSYSVSHDLRAPLRAMQGFSHVLLEEHASNLGPVETDYLRRIIKSSERMDRLIQDVLAYSRAARVELKLHTVDVEKLIGDVIQQYPALQPPRAEIHVERPLLRVKGHDASLTQCLSNLLANAVKFVAPGILPKIRIWTESRDGAVRLWIEDNGIGIAPKYQERIFGMFQRVHPDSAYEGTGIGLAIVNKAVLRMGGQLGVESEEGKGSRFWMQLQRGDS